MPTKSEMLDALSNGRYDLDYIKEYGWTLTVHPKDATICMTQKKGRE